MLRTVDGGTWSRQLLLDGTETPAMVLAPGLASARAEAFKRALPDVGLFYAVKALADETFVRALVGRVNGFDVASLGEIEMLMCLGVEPATLLFSNPVKIPAHIEKAHALGVQRFALDSSDEIRKLSQWAPGSEVFLRIQVTDVGSAFPLSSKFGVRPSELEYYARQARAAGLDVAGLSFHVGSQSTSPTDWLAALRVAVAAIEQLAESGIKIRTLNLGGGFPAVYAQADLGRFEAIAAAVSQFLRSRLPPDVAVIAEPGRYLAANAGVMVTEVIATEIRSGERWAYLDLGVFQGLMEPLEMANWRYPITNLSRRDRAEWDSFTLTGPTCDAYDTIGHGYRLPTDTAAGDRLVIEAAGAYSLVYASRFNGFDPPGVIYV